MIDRDSFPAHMVKRQFHNGTFDYIIQPPEGWQGTASETMVWCREEAARLGVPLMGRVGADGSVQHRVAELPPTQQADQLDRACHQAGRFSGDVPDMLQALDAKAAEWVDNEELPREQRHVGGHWLLTKDELRQKEAVRLVREHLPATGDP